MNHDPPGDRVRARLALSEASRQTAEYARTLVPTYTDSHAQFGEYLTSARRLRLAAERAIDAAIAVEHANGASIEQIATWLALPVDTITMRLQAVLAKAATVDPTAAAHDLDTWYAATGGPDAPADAVSAGLGLG